MPQSDGVPEQFQPFNVDRIARPAVKQEESFSQDYRYESDPGFFASLFDTSFESSITPKIVKASYVLFMMFDALVVIVILVAGFANFFIRLIAAVIVFFVLLIWVRLGFETMMTLHNIEKYARRTSRMSDTFTAIERNTRTGGQGV
jgi:hypothetical protein